MKETTLSDGLDRLDDIFKKYEKRIANQQEIIYSMSRNNFILLDAMAAAQDGFNELGKITSTYHRKILQKTATLEDVKECSKITRRAIKHVNEFQRLAAFYNSIKSNPISTDERQIDTIVVGSKKQIC